MPQCHPACRSALQVICLSYEPQRKEDFGLSFWDEQDIKEDMLKDIFFVKISFLHEGVGKNLIQF